MATRMTLTAEEPDAPSWGWWLLVLIGVVSIVAGGILVAKPSNSLATLAVVFGIFLLLDGIFGLIGSFTGPAEHRTLGVIIALLAIVIGILLIRHPTHAVSAIGLLIGIWLVAAGTVRLLAALVTGGLLRIVIALLEIVVGIVIVSDPHIGYATLAILLGIYLIINGLAWIGLGFAVRAAT